MCSTAGLLTFKDIDKHSRIFQLCISVLSKWCPLSEPGPCKAGNSPRPDGKCRPHLLLFASVALICIVLYLKTIILSIICILYCLFLLNSVIFLFISIFRTLAVLLVLDLLFKYFCNHILFILCRNYFCCC